VLAQEEATQRRRTRSDALRSVIAVKICDLHRDLTALSYDELFDLYRNAVAAMREATAADAKRIELEIVTPLNEELTRRSQKRLKR
jgi:hypothetical protein